MGKVQVQTSCSSTERDEAPHGYSKCGQTTCSWRTGRSWTDLEMRSKWKVKNRGADLVITGKSMELFARFGAVLANLQRVRENFSKHVTFTMLIKRS